MEWNYIVILQYRCLYNDIWLETLRKGTQCNWETDNRKGDAKLDARQYD